MAPGMLEATAMPSRPWVPGQLDLHVHLATLQACALPCIWPTLNAMAASQTIRWQWRQLGGRLEGPLLCEPE